MITEVTRRNIFDTLKLEAIRWSGRLEEPDFLSRMYDLNELPSTDSRYKTAYRDIWQHRINNHDWEDDWIFTDSRFDLLRGDDETFLRFLCETIHPVVRTDEQEVERMRQMYNSYLSEDGFELIEKARISGKPVFAARRMETPAGTLVSTLKESIKEHVDTNYVVRQITRMEAAVNDDPDLAIGTAKELLESVCKTILEERNIEYDANLDLPPLVKKTAKALRLTPEDIPKSAKASETIRIILSNLASVANGIAELRNGYGTGHGKGAKTKGLSSRHSKLAVGASSTLALFLMETHRETSES